MAHCTRCRRAAVTISIYRRTTPVPNITCSHSARGGNHSLAAMPKRGHRGGWPLRPPRQAASIPRSEGRAHDAGSNESPQRRRKRQRRRRRLRCRYRRWEALARWATARSSCREGQSTAPPPAPPPPPNLSVLPPLPCFVSTLRAAPLKGAPMSKPPRGGYRPHAWKQNTPRWTSPAAAARATSAAVPDATPLSAAQATTRGTTEGRPSVPGPGCHRRRHGGLGRTGGLG